MPRSPDKNHPLNLKKDGNVLRTRKIKNIPLYDRKRGNGEYLSPSFPSAPYPEASIGQC
jgi:hypothetical protein